MHENIAEHQVRLVTGFVIQKHEAVVWVDTTAYSNFCIAIISLEIGRNGRMQKRLNKWLYIIIAWYIYGVLVLEKVD